MKWVLWISVLAIMAMGVSACGETSTSVSSGDNSYPVFSDNQELTSAEQEVLDFCETHYRNIEKLVEMENAIVDNPPDTENEFSARLDRISTLYAQEVEEYTTTNNGELAGGAVAYLEELWETEGEYIQTVALGYFDIFLEKNVDTTEIAIALADAASGLDDIKAEIESLQDTY